MPLLEMSKGLIRTRVQGDPIPGTIYKIRSSPPLRSNISEAIILPNMLSPKIAITAALLLAGVDGLVFKAVNHCSTSIPIVPPKGRLAKRQEFCNAPFIVAYADDGTQLTFNGGQKTVELGQEKNVDGGPCYATNADYNGTAIGVDSSPGHYTGGLLKFLSCQDGSAEVKPTGCRATINGMENLKSTKTNCNECDANGFTTSCNCCAVTY
ncbi:hypothetical protein PRZ48_007598 [Zasmidium cellare]|uniref:Uncharacterized protein n=1 Tax=Zasmidium cellare TaxID=395010 RepID=A0ABR0EJR3_ZASCE|nr:hypothetical protein PRZ48_007598 [Zasmidium cellare]